MSKRATPEELAQEAAGWADGTLTMAGWQDAPHAVPRARETLSLTLPAWLTHRLREVAKAKGVGLDHLVGWYLSRVLYLADTFKKP